MCDNTDKVIRTLCLWRHGSSVVRLVFTLPQCPVEDQALFSAALYSTRAEREDGCLPRPTHLHRRAVLRSVCVHTHPLRRVRANIIGAGLNDCPPVFSVVPPSRCMSQGGSAVCVSAVGPPPERLGPWILKCLTCRPEAQSWAPGSREVLQRQTPQMGGLGTSMGWHTSFNGHPALFLKFFWLRFF